MQLNTEHLQRCIVTLEKSLLLFSQYTQDSVEYEIFRNAIIKGYELTLETAGKLLRKALKPYFATSKEVDQLVFKDLFRYAAKHAFISTAEAQRWFKYRENRNNTAHDYGVGFAKDTIILLPQFIQDVKNLKEKLDNVNS
jgi:hypothetical protein